jgi:hypothetical protein
MSSTLNSLKLYQYKSGETVEVYRTTNLQEGYRTPPDPPTLEGKYTIPDRVYIVRNSVFLCKVCRDQIRRPLKAIGIELKLINQDKAGQLVSDYNTCGSCNKKLLEKV